MAAAVHVSSVCLSVCTLQGMKLSLVLVDGDYCHTALCNRLQIYTESTSTALVGCWCLMWCNRTAGEANLKATCVPRLTDPSREGTVEPSD